MAIDHAWFADRTDDFKASVAFLTRLPLPRTEPITGAGIARAVWAFPIAGLIVGLFGALVFVLARRAGLPAWPGAALALVATLAVTGCLHEDGLADTADGFGGGKTRQQKLDIMRDSRTGAYGVCALALSILLRASALASLSDPALVVPALIAAHGAGRATMPMLMLLAPPARADGLSYEFGRPPRDSVVAAAILGILLLTICLGPALAIAAVILLVAVTAAVTWLSVAQIGGQTGDVLGALEQVSEIVILLVALRLARA
jgi:adenosylcobinamide-GDP ribazoletransferase